MIEIGRRKLAVCLSFGSLIAESSFIDLDTYGPVSVAERHSVEGAAVHFLYCEEIVVYRCIEDSFLDNDVLKHVVCHHEAVPAKVLFSRDVKFSHPYTEGLLASVPRLDTDAERLEAIPGAVPHPLDLPKGCKFAPRCKYATERCMCEEPEMVQISEKQQIRCFYPNKEERHGKQK